MCTESNNAPAKKIALAVWPPEATIDQPCMIGRSKGHTGLICRLVSIE